MSRSLSFVGFRRFVLRWPMTRSAPPAPVALARTGAPLLALGPWLAAVDGGRDGADEPRVDRQALAVSAFLDLALELVREAQVDPRGPPLSGRRPTRGQTRGRLSAIGLLALRLGRRDRDHELRFAPAQAQFDRARSELAGDLGRRRRERIQQSQSHGGFQRRGQSLREQKRLLAAGRGRRRELLAKLVFIGF